MNKLLLILTSLILISFTNYAFAQFADPLVVLETNQGDIVIEFFHLDAPNHVENFLLLSNTGYYDGVLFHRIIPGFMIQSGDPNTIDGDPNTWGQGGDGALSDRIEAEFNNIQHDRGIVSMARSSDPNSAGSQFFIVTSDNNTEALDRQYTVFGKVTEGMDVAHKIENLPKDGNDCPKQEAKMLEVTISE